MDVGSLECACRIDVEWAFGDSYLVIYLVGLPFFTIPIDFHFYTRSCLYQICIKKTSLKAYGKKYDVLTTASLCKNSIFLLL